jgi:hypothetical protein
LFSTNQTQSAIQDFVCYKKNDYLLLYVKKNLKTSSIIQHPNSILTKQNITLPCSYIQKENKKAAVKSNY